MDGQMLALLGVAALAGAGSLSRRSGSLAARYRVVPIRRGGYAILDTVTGDSSAKYGETWKRKADAEAVVQRLMAVIAAKVAA